MRNRLRTLVGIVTRNASYALLFVALCPLLAVWAVFHFTALGLERVMDGIEIWVGYGGDRDAFEEDQL